MSQVGANAEAEDKAVERLRKAAKDITKLSDQKSYPSWKKKVEKALERVGYECLVYAEPPPNMSRRIKLKVAWWLENLIEDTLWRRIESSLGHEDVESWTFKIWTWLEDQFLPDVNDVIQVYDDLMNLTFNPGKFEEYLNEYYELMTFLELSDTPPREPFRMFVLMRSLPLKYNKIKKSLKFTNAYEIIQAIKNEERFYAGQWEKKRRNLVHR